MSGIRCDEIIRDIPLYCYGEVSSAVEERMESHFEECQACREELAHHRAFLDILDRRPDASESLMSESMTLAECRNQLRAEIAAEAKRAESRGWPSIWMDKVRQVLDIHIPFRVPAGAMALIALGWFGARYTPEKFGGIRADIAAPMFSSVSSVEPDPTGRVQIAVDDVHRHVVIGDLQDPRIQELLLTAVREESNPGVRLESIGVLQNSGDSEDVQRALIDAVSRDPNAEVRLKAIEGLKQYAGDSVVRKTLANVLLKDDNPGVRVRAIDLLTAQHDDSIVGVLQDVVEKEDNSYVRAHTMDLLEAMRASVGIY